MLATILFALAPLAAHPASACGDVSPRSYECAKIPEPREEVEIFLAPKTTPEKVRGFLHAGFADSEYRLLARTGDRCVDIALSDGSTLIDDKSLFRKAEQRRNWMFPTFDGDTLGTERILRARLLGLRGDSIEWFRMGENVFLFGLSSLIFLGPAAAIQNTVVTWLVPISDDELKAAFPVHDLKDVCKNDFLANAKTSVVAGSRPASHL